MHVIRPCSPQQGALGFAQALRALGVTMSEAVGMRKFSGEQVEKLRAALADAGEDPRLLEDVCEGDHACWAGGVQMATILARLYGYLSGELPPVKGLGMNGCIRASLILAFGVCKRVRKQIRDARREAKKEGRKFPERLQYVYDELQQLMNLSVPTFMGAVTAEDVAQTDWRYDAEAIGLVVAFQHMREAFETAAGPEYHRAMAVLKGMSVLKGLEVMPTEEVIDLGAHETLAETAEA